MARAPSAAPCEMCLGTKEIKTDVCAAMGCSLCCGQKTRVELERIELACLHTTWVSGGRKPFTVSTTVNPRPIVTELHVIMAISGRTITVEPGSASKIKEQIFRSMAEQLPPSCQLSTDDLIKLSVEHDDGTTEFLSGEVVVKKSSGILYAVVSPIKCHPTYGLQSYTSLEKLIAPEKLKAVWDKCAFAPPSQ